MFSIITMTADAASISAGSALTPLIMMVLMIVVLYFIMIRPQRKKEKADAEMRKNVQVGDEIETVGGIVGFIVKIDDTNNTVVIETGSDRSKMRIKKWAIATNVTASEDAAKAKEESSKAEKPAKKGKKDEELPIEKD